MTTGEKKKVIHTWLLLGKVKGFSVVNEAKVGVFLKFSCFFCDPTNVSNFISGSSAFSKSSLNIWNFSVHILLKPNLENFEHYFASVCCCCCKVASVVSNSMQPHRRQPTRLLHPWDSPGKNTGVGCHFLLQCMKVKSEREVAQSCPTLSMDYSLPGSSVHGIFQARVLEWSAIAFSENKQ